MLDPLAVELIGWTVMHSLWQCALLGVLYPILTRIPPLRTAPRKHAAGLVLLAFMLITPLGTFLWMGGSVRAVDPGPLVLATELRQHEELSRLGGWPTFVQDAPHQSAGGIRTMVELFRAALPWIVVGWFVPMGLLIARQIGGLAFLYHVLKRDWEPLEAGWHHLHELPAKAGLRMPVRIVQTSLVEVPATVGWWRPVILVPTTALEAMTRQEIDALVVHELAHIRRGDYLLNGLQTCIETLLFFHPAVWWLSRQVRQEREHACDDVAAELTSGPAVYAGVLYRLAQLRMQLPQPVLSARGGVLTQRIGRLLGRPEVMLEQRSNLWGSVLAGLTLLTIGSQLLSNTFYGRWRHLDQVQPLGAIVYQLLEVKSDGSDLLQELAAVMQSEAGAWDEQAVARLVHALNHDARSDALCQRLVEGIEVHDSIGYQSRADWSFGSYYERRLLADFLWSKALALADDAPGDARSYARAAVLLGGQESSLFGGSAMERLLSQPDLPRIAGINQRQLVQLRRHVEDHRELTRAFLAQLEIASDAMMRLRQSSEPDPQAVARLRDSLAFMSSLAKQRPDMQWRLANFVWRLAALNDHRADVLTQVTSAIVIDSPEMARWMLAAQKHKPETITPPIRVIRPEQLHRFRIIEKPEDVGR